MNQEQQPPTIQFATIDELIKQYLIDAQKFMRTLHAEWLEDKTVKEKGGNLAFFMPYGIYKVVKSPPEVFNLKHEKLELLIIKRDEKIADGDYEKAEQYFEKIEMLSSSLVELKISEKALKITLDILNNGVPVREHYQEAAKLRDKIQMLKTEIETFEVATDETN